MNHPTRKFLYAISSGSRGAKGAMPPPPDPVKISYKKDGRQGRPHRFHVSRPLSTWPLDPLLAISKPCLTCNSGLSTPGTIFYYQVGGEDS